MIAVDTLRVLVVDDEAGMRETLVDILEDVGYEVSSAADGEAGLRLALAGDVDVVVLDVQMPLRDGFGVIEMLKPPPPVVIIMTAYAVEERLREAVTSNVYAVVHKPFHVSHLLRLVARAGSGEGAP